MLAEAASEAAAAGGALGGRPKGRERSDLLREPGSTLDAGVE
jgi:hypothetical protein